MRRDRQNGFGGLRLWLFLGEICGQLGRRFGGVMLEGGRGRTSGEGRWQRGREADGVWGEMGIILVHPVNE